LLEQLECISISTVERRLRTMRPHQPHRPRKPPRAPNVALQGVVGAENLIRLRVVVHCLDLW